MNQKKIKDLKILKCSDETEWEAVRHFRQKYFFDPNNTLDLNCAPMFRPKKYKIERLLFL